MDEVLYRVCITRCYADVKTTMIHRSGNVLSHYSVACFVQSCLELKIQTWKTKKKIQVWNMDTGKQMLEYYHNQRICIMILIQ